MSPHLHHALQVQSKNAITDTSSAKAPIHAVPWCGTDQPICLKGVGTGPCLGQHHQVRVSERDTQLPQRREFSIPGKTGHLLCYCRVPSCSERLLRHSSPLSGGGHPVVLTILACLGQKRFLELWTSPMLKSAKSQAPSSTLWILILASLLTSLGLSVNFSSLKF